MPPPAVFKPDPLLSRAQPQGRGDFDVAPLLAPVVPAFRPDPVLVDEAWDEAAGGGLLLSGPDGEAREAGFVPDGLPALPDGGQEAAPGPVNTAAEHLPGPATPVVGLNLEEQLQLRYREGFEDGLAEGSRLAAEVAGAMPAPMAEGVATGADGRDAVLLLEALSRALQPLLLPDDASTRFEPLKRLALHLAMELVRTELSVSPQVVERLVQRSLQALQAGDQSPLVVELHPQDLALLKPLMQDPNSGLAADAPLLQRVQWKEDAELTRGSVRARSDVSTVEDLIQHRLASIMQDLRIQAGQWQRDEAALQAALAPQAERPESAVEPSDPTPPAQEVEDA